MIRKNIVRLTASLMIFVVFLLPYPAVAQGAFRVRVDYLDNSQFPVIKAYISVSDPSGLPIKDIKADSFTLVEDGTVLAIKDFAPVQNMAQALSIALVMDTSVSMGSGETPTPMQRSVEAAKSFVDQLQPQDRVTVIKFSEKTEEVTPLTEDKASIKKALDTLQPEKKYTALYDGIVAAVKALESQSGRRIIVVITDGKDTGSGLFDFETAMRQASGASIPVYPMGFGSIINVKEMKQMAELTGGVAQILPKAADLQSSFTEILNILREQYLVSYVSALPADDKDHELLVTVSYGGGQEQTSYHFIAKSSSISLTLPNYQPDQIIGGMVNFTPQTDWPAPLKSLEILVDGVKIAKVETEPFEYKWNSFASEIAQGVHNFLFKVTDVSGNTGQAELPLNVQPPIVVEIIQPDENSAVSGLIEIIANVTTLPGISLSRVSFVVDGKEITSAPAVAGTTEYKAIWDTREYPAQSHPLSVIAYDTEGLFTTEQKIQASVKVGGYSGMIVLVVLVIALLVIPVAMRSRRRAGKSPMAGGGVGVPMGGQPALRELEGMNPNQVWPLGMSEIKLGRKRDENDIPLKGLNASRRHASIRFEQGQYVIYSNSPNNQVLVNNMPIQQKQALKSGDMIQLGETILLFEK